MKEGRYGGGEGTMISGDGEGDQVWPFEAGLGDHDGEDPPAALPDDGLGDHAGEPSAELPLAPDPEGDWRVDEVSVDPATSKHPTSDSRSRGKQFQLMLNEERLADACSFSASDNCAWS